MWEMIQTGGPVMYPLIGLSFLSVAVVIERTLFWLRVKRCRDAPLLNKVLRFVEEEDMEAAANFGPKTKDFIARTLLNGLRHRHYSLSLALETQSVIELKRMRRNLVVLDTIITAAPLLGILGTVLGIILSFDILGAQEIADPKLVTKGISEALLTTAYGLSVAIFTIFPFNIFQSKYTDAAEELEKNCSTLEMLVCKNLEKAKMERINIRERKRVKDEIRE